jgi:hypothetical protein
MKSQRRRVHDCATPTIVLAGPYHDPKLEICVHPIGDTTRAVTFQVSLYQWRDMKAAGMDACTIARDRIAGEWRRWSEHAKPEATK